MAESMNKSNSWDTDMVLVAYLRALDSSEI